MLKQVITVDGPAAYGPEDQQQEARRDAERCIAALRKEFPEVEFVGKPGPMSFWSIEVEAPRGAGISEIVAFARGFMASAHLWER